MLFIDVPRPYIPANGIRVFFKHRRYTLSWKWDKPVLTNSRGWESYYLVPSKLGDLYNYDVLSIDTNNKVGVMNCHMRNTSKVGYGKFPYWY